MIESESDFSDPEIEEFRNLRLRGRPQGYKNSIVIRPIPSRFSWHPMGISVPFCASEAPKFFEDALGWNAWVSLAWVRNWREILINHSYLTMAVRSTVIDAIILWASFSINLASNWVIRDTFSGENGKSKINGLYVIHSQWVIRDTFSGENGKSKIKYYIGPIRTLNDACRLDGCPIRTLNDACRLDGC
ncbi:hypothetical protein GQR58_022738 [Nymphon striatum]|nr:hypothetical protein GQR58_022738 [Nymphon striatum]